MGISRFSIIGLFFLNEKQETSENQAATNTRHRRVEASKLLIFDDICDANDCAVHNVQLDTHRQ